MELSNQTKYLTVRALTQYLKRKFDADPYLQKVFVVGEVSNFRYRQNGHQYFNLKDDDAKISAMVFKNVFEKIPFKLEEGMKVLITGSVTLYERNGNYQIVVESIQPDGVGALYQALEQLKKEFADKGLFEQLQRPIPLFPKKIAVITSPTGSVIHDILTTVRRRFPIVNITVFPTKVQGEGSATEIVDAFNELDKVVDEYDTVILARGGGSIEDLWSFNEREVAYAILRCKIPVISSIGHETDTTIADLVADLRAATPTAAAELAVPVLVDLLNHVNQTRDRIFFAMNQRIKHLKKQLDPLVKSYVLQQPERLYQAYSQQLDLAKLQMNHLMEQYLQTQSKQHSFLNQRLQIQSPIKQISVNNDALSKQTLQLHRNIQHYLNLQNRKFSESINLLEAYSPLKIMARGYSVIEQNQQLIKHVADIDMKKEIKLTLQDGSAIAKVKEISYNNQERKKENNGTNN